MTARDDGSMPDALCPHCQAWAPRSEWESADGQRVPSAFAINGIGVPEPDCPSLDDLFPDGSRVAITHPMSTRTIAAGTIVGHTEGLYDHGSPESGPGPVEEAELLVVACDDGRTRHVYPGDALPDDER